MSATVSTLVTSDNENNAHTGVADGDMNVWAQWSSANPVEFNIPVANFGLITGATLRIDAFDVDPAELDQIRINGHLLGTLEAADGITHATFFYFDPAFLVAGNNIITAYNINDHSNPDNWWFSVVAAQLITYVSGAVIEGTALGDDIQGGDGDGDTRIQGGAGSDTLDGGGHGVDTVDYSDKTAPVVLQLIYNAQTVVTVGGVNEDLIKRFQNAVGGSGDDTLTGDGNANHLFGNNGNDRLYGGDGDDFLNGGSGNDLFDGGLGKDTADFSGYGSNITVDLNITTAQRTGVGMGRDTFVNIESVQGGSGNDVLKSNEQNNWLYGGLGNDTLYAGDKLHDGGALYGEGGDDTFYVGSISDHVFHGAFFGVYGGDGNDTVIEVGWGNYYVDVDGGQGDDWVEFRGFTTGVLVVDLVARDVWLTANGDTDTGYGVIANIYNVENLVGSPQFDILSGTDGENHLFGQGGGDQINGRGGADYIDGGKGGDDLNGGAGDDFIFGGDGDDSIHPDGFYDASDAGLGQGSDTIYAGNGDDFVSVEGYYGGDSYFGGGGSDWLDFSQFDYGRNSPAFIIDLRETTFKNGSVNAGFDHGTDTFAGFENVIGTEYRDTIVGNGADNTLTGGGGDDGILAEGGDDTIYDSLGIDESYGGHGDDTIWTGPGDDILDGGPGNDTIVFGTLTPFGPALVDIPVTFILNYTRTDGLSPIQDFGALGFDLVKGFENVVGGDGSDHLTGGAGANVMSGSGGDDHLSGGKGNDVLHGDADNDTLWGQAGRDRLDGGAGADTLDGGAGADKLHGGDGADTFQLSAVSYSKPGAGRDVITDFSLGDKIDLSIIDADTNSDGDQAFVLIGAHRFHHQAGELRVVHGKHSVVVAGDVNGDGKADFQILVLHHTSLGPDDFTF